MPLPRRDELDFLFRDGRGIRTDQIHWEGDLPQEFQDYIEAQNPTLFKWNGEVNPTTIGFTRIPGQTLPSPYDSAGNYWRIQNGTTGATTKAGLYIENGSLDYTQGVVNLDIHIERGGSNDGSTGLLLGADTSAGMAWAGDASEGFGLWVNRLSDGRLFWLFRSNGLGQYLSGTTAIEAVNGAVLGSNVVANAAMTVPETDDRVLVQLVTTGRYVYFYVNGTHYFTADLPASWIAEYENFGPRIAVVGDNGSISKEVRLYRLSIGTPDPLDISPDTLPKDVPVVPDAAGDYVMRRAAGGARSWATASAAAADVVVASANTAIPTTANGNTYVNQGSSNITYTLPAASGGGAVDDGWEAVFTNQGSGDLTITGNGADTIDASSSDIVLEINETIRIQKVANGAWVLIADTRGGDTEDSLARNSAQEALEAAQQNRDRIGPLEQKTEDVNIVDDGPTYAEAAAAEAGIAIFAEGSTVGDGLLGGSRPLEAGDLTGYVWTQSQATGATRQAIIVRIEGTLGPNDFALNVDGAEREMHDYRKVLSDDTWDYFYAGSAVSAQLRIDKKARAHHTEWRGAIGGRAFEQVEAAIEAHEPAPSATVDPPVWGDDASPRTLFVTLHDLRPTPALRAVDKIRLDLQGALFVTQSWNLLYGARTIAFPLSDTTELTNIANNVSPDGNNNVVRGQIQFHATAGGNPTDDNEVVDARLSFSMSVVAPGAVPQPGGHTTFVVHPRVFHANAFITVDPDNNTLRRINFSPNEAGLVPIPNSLFTFVWGHAAGFNLSGFTMAPRGTQAAQATTVSVTARDGVTSIAKTGDLIQNATYLARFTGSSVIVLTQLKDSVPADDDGGGGSVTTSLIGDLWFTAGPLPETAAGSRFANIPWVASAEASAANVSGVNFSGTGTIAGDYRIGNTLIVNKILGLFVEVLTISNGVETLLNQQFMGLKEPDTTVELDLTTGTAQRLEIAIVQTGITSSSIRMWYQGGTSPANLYVRFYAVPTELMIPAADLDEDAVNALIAARHNLLIDSPAAPIAASADNEDKVLYRAKRLYKNEPIHFADPAATYRDFAAATDLPDGYSWGGAVQVSPSASAQPDNRVIYSIPGGHFLRKITGGGSAWWVNYTPSGWRGPVTDQSDADRVVKAVGDKVFFGGKVQVVATYTPRTPDVFHWVPLVKERFEHRVGASPAVLPEGTYEISVKMDRTSNAQHLVKRILVSELTAVDEEYRFQFASGSQTLGTFTVRYTAATRTLTYAAGGNANPTVSITAIGEA